MFFHLYLLTSFSLLIRLLIDMFKSSEKSIPFIFYSKFANVCFSLSFTLLLYNLFSCISFVFRFFSYNNPSKVFLHFHLYFTSSDSILILYFVIIFMIISQFLALFYQNVQFMFCFNYKSWPLPFKVTIIW